MYLGFYGDTFSDGFGGFQTMRKRNNDHDIWQNYIGYLEKQYRDNDMGYNRMSRFW